MEAGKIIPECPEKITNDPEQVKPLKAASQSKGPLSLPTPIGGGGIRSHQRHVSLEYVDLIIKKLCNRVKYIRKDCLSTLACFYLNLILRQVILSLLNRI